MKKLVLKRTTHEEQEKDDLASMRSLTPEQRLELLEELRQEGARLGFYEYPERLERVITITRRARR